MARSNNLARDGCCHRLCMDRRRAGTGVQAEHKKILTRRSRFDSGETVYCGSLGAPGLAFAFPAIVSLDDVRIARRLVVSDKSQQNLE